MPLLRNAFSPTSISGIVSVDNKLLNNFSCLTRLGIRIDPGRSMIRDIMALDLGDINNRNPTIEELDITPFLPNTLLMPGLAYHGIIGSHTLLHLSITLSQQSAVRLMTDSIQNLHSLHLARTGDQINRVLSDRLAQLLNLRFLTLSLVYHRHFHDKEMYTTLGTFVEGCPNLEHLSLSRAYRNWNHDDAIFDSICEILPKLKSLRVLVIEIFTIPYIAETNFVSALPRSLEVLSLVMGDLEQATPVSVYYH